MPAALATLLQALDSIASLPIGGGLSPAIPFYAHTIAGTEERYWLLPIGVEAGLDGDGNGTTDVTVRVDPVLSGTTVTGIRLRIERNTSITATVGIGIRTDGAVVTNNQPGDWVYARFARDGMPVPDRLDLRLESTGDLDQPGHVRELEVELGVTGPNVAPDLPTGLRVDALGGTGTASMQVPGRVPSLVGISLPIAQDIFVADVSELGGIETRLAGASGPIQGPAPQLELTQREELLETIAAAPVPDPVVKSEISAQTTQSLDIDARLVAPGEPIAHLELRRLATQVTFVDEPVLVTDNGQRRRDGTKMSVDVDSTTDSATIRLPTETGGLAACVLALRSFDLRLRAADPLLAEMPSGAGPGDALPQPLGAVIIESRPSHPVGTLGVPLQLPQQAAELDRQGAVLEVGVVAPRRVVVRQAVDAVHSRSNSPTGAQDWLLDLALGNGLDVLDRTLGAGGIRPLRVRVQNETTKILARAADLPDELTLDLHVDADDGGGLGVRLEGEVAGLRVLATLPPGEDGRTRPQINAAIPMTADGGLDLVVAGGLPTISSATVATAMVGAHTLGVPAEDGSPAIDSVDVLTRIPPTVISAGQPVATPSVAVRPRIGDEGLRVECSEPTGSRVAVTGPGNNRIAVRPTPQIGLGLAEGPATLTSATSPPPERITARVLGLRSLSVGGDPPDNTPLSLPQAQVRLASSRVNRSLRVHTFEGPRQDLRVRIADLPDDVDVDLRTAAPVGVDGTPPGTELRAVTRIDLDASDVSGEVVLAGRPTARTKFGPTPGTRVGIGWLSGRIQSIPRRLTVLGLSDPALFLDPTDDSETKPELWQDMPAKFVRDGLHIAVSDPLIVCRLASIAPDRSHPSDGTVMWAYTYIHGLRIAPSAPIDGSVTRADLPAFTLWNPAVVPTDQDSFEEPDAAGSFRVGPRDDNATPARVDLWLGKSEKLAGPGEVDALDLLPANTFSVESELIFNGWGGHIAVSEEFGTDPRKVDAHGPGDWWIRSVGKFPLLGIDVTLANDQFGLFFAGERPDFTDPCGG